MPIRYYKDNVSDGLHLRIDERNHPPRIYEQL
jgi:hypothetical protein